MHKLIVRLKFTVHRPTDRPTEFILPLNAITRSLLRIHELKTSELVHSLHELTFYLRKISTVFIFSDKVGIRTLILWTMCGL